MKLCPSCKLRYPEEATQCFVDRTALIAAPDPYLGAVVAGRYRIEEVLGSGGMSTVYRAMGSGGERPVAVKIFRRELLGDGKLRERFRREAANTRRLAHRNIIEILDEGELDDGVPFLVMELLQGNTLEGVLKRANGALGIERAVHLLRQLAAGLARAHDFQVLHRDLKPENLYVCPQPDGSELLKILDFGIGRFTHDTRLTNSGEIFGTPQYMAPERITSTEAGTAADLYAMGCIMYRCVTGVLPFVAKDVTGFLVQHLREIPRPPRLLNAMVPPELDALILQCLEKEPALRPVDAHAIERALSALGASHPLPRRPSGGLLPQVPAVRTIPPEVVRTSVHGMFTAESASRWGRRVEIFGAMLSRAFPSGTTPALAESFGALRSTALRMTEVHAQWRVQQQRIDALAAQARDAHERFGRAMDALGEDLSQSRQRAQAAHAEVHHARELRRDAQEQFARAHAAVLALGADVVAGPEAVERYRSASTALDSAAGLQERARAAGEAALAREAEGKDLAFQIEALRAQLEHVAQTSEDEEAAVQTEVGALATDLAQMEASLVGAANALTTALRGREDLAALFRELETNAA